MQCYKIGIQAYATTPDKKGRRDVGTNFLPMTLEQIKDELYVKRELEAWRGRVAKQLDLDVKDVVLITPEESERIIEEEKVKSLSEARDFARSLGRMCGMSEEEIDEMDKAVLGNMGLNPDTLN